MSPELALPEIAGKVGYGRLARSGGVADSVDEAKAAARPLGLARRARSGEAPGPGTAGFDRAKRSRGGARAGKPCLMGLPPGPASLPECPGSSREALG